MRSSTTSSSQRRSCDRAIALGLPFAASVTSLDLAASRTAFRSPSHFRTSAMAGFKTHITTSTLLGIGDGSWRAFAFYHVPLPTCVLAAGLCGVSGMLPDLDSGPGRPLRESMAFAAAVVPMMLIASVQAFGLAPETIVLLGGGDLSADSLRRRLAAAAFHGPSRDVSQLAGGADRGRVDVS